MKKPPPKPRASKARRRPAVKAQRVRGAANRGGTVKLPAQCTLADADGLKLRLAKLLKSVKPVTVDARRVARIDTASLQLLAAFALERRASNLMVKFASSEEFSDATRVLGFVPALDTGAARTAGDIR